MKKFNVGDEIIGRKDSPYGITKTGWKGYVLNVHNGDLIEVGKAMFTDKSKAQGYLVNARYFDLVRSAVEDKKIVITVKGDETIATLFEGSNPVKKAVAKCSPEDAFVFETGAKLAVERLFDSSSASYKIVKLETYLIGDKVKIVDKWNENTKENRDGLMDKWLGKIMTIMARSEERGYYMVEDEEEHDGCGWLWNTYCIEGKIVDNVTPNVKQGKRLVPRYDGDDKGCVGMFTLLKDINGVQLFVGDTVEVFNAELVSVGKAFVCHDDIQGDFIDGIALSTNTLQNKGNVANGWKIIKRAGFKELKIGDRINNMKVVES